MNKDSLADMLPKKYTWRFILCFWILALGIHLASGDETADLQKQIDEVEVQFQALNDKRNELRHLQVKKEMDKKAVTKIEGVVDVDVHPADQHKGWSSDRAKVEQLLLYKVTNPTLTEAPKLEMVREIPLEEYGHFTLTDTPYGNYILAAKCKGQWVYKSMDVHVNSDDYISFGGHIYE